MVQHTQQGSVLLKILAPDGWVLVAGEDHIKTVLFVVASINQVKEQLGILLVKGTMANLVIRQEGRTRPLRQKSVFPKCLACQHRKTKNLKRRTKNDPNAGNVFAG